MVLFLVTSLNMASFLISILGLISFSLTFIVSVIFVTFPFQFVSDTCDPLLCVRILSPKMRTTLVLISQTELPS